MKNELFIKKVVKLRPTMSILHSQNSKIVKYGFPITLVFDETSKV